MNSYFSLNILRVLKYFLMLSVSFHDVHSLFGFFMFIVIMSQLVSGVALSFSLVPEPMLIPMVRDEEDLEDMYIEDFFWLHERGVDLIFIFSYLHLFRKIYLNVFEYEHEDAWKSGIFSFMLFQVVVFLGLVLSCTHLSEITLTIAANVMHTFFLFYGKAYWWIFTDKQLNTDTLIRLAYAHYLSAFYLAYVATIHGIDMHYDWKNETSYDGLEIEMVWWDEALSNELSMSIDILMIIALFFWFFYTEPEALTYEIFMWGDIGLLTDIRFYGVAPHWYFRAFMAWLIVCPHHKTGIFGLLLFFFLLFHQVTLHGINEQNNYSKKNLTILKNKLKKSSTFSSNYSNSELDIYFQLTWGLFVMCCLYTTSFLPYGRFYNRLNGNIGMLGAYFYVFAYLSFSSFRRPQSLEWHYNYIYTRVRFLKNVSLN